MKKPRQPVTSPNSGTQMTAGQGDQGAVTASDDTPRTLFSSADAVKAFASHVTASVTSTFDAVCAGAIAYLSAAYLSGGGKKDVDAVTVKMAQFCKEKGVKRSMAWNILTASKSLGGWLYKTHHLGGPVADIRGAADPMEALAMLKGSLAAKGVNSYNTVHNLVNPKNIWTPDKQAAFEKSQTPESKAAAATKRKRDATLNANKTAIDTIVDRPAVISQVMRKAAESENYEAILQSFVNAIVATDALDSLITLATARKVELAESGSQTSPSRKGKGESATAH